MTSRCSCGMNGWFSPPDPGCPDHGTDARAKITPELLSQLSAKASKEERRIAFMEGAGYLVLGKDGQANTEDRFERWHRRIYGY